MGLDMYLRASVNFYAPPPEAEANPYTQIRALTSGQFPFVTGDSSWITVSVGAAYWRKANAIHRWFVEQVQDGQDDGRSYGVRREQLAELLLRCQTVSAEPGRAEELLPTQEGFFFGGTEYDEYYFACIEATIRQLTSLLNAPNHHLDFAYEASW